MCGWKANLLHECLECQAPNENKRSLKKHLHSIGASLNKHTLYEPPAAAVNMINKYLNDQIKGRTSHTLNCTAPNKYTANSLIDKNFTITLQGIELQGKS